MTERAAVVAAAALVLLAGCGAEEGADVLGDPVTPAGELSTPELAWSADGSEIFYVSNNGIKAARADGSGVRVLDDSKAEYWTLIAAPDDSALYYTASESASEARALYEAHAARRLDAVAIEQKADLIAVSPDAGRLAYVGGGALRLHDVAGGGVTSLGAVATSPVTTQGNHGWIGFAPAGDRLFVVTRSEDAARGVLVMDLAGAAGETIPLRDAAIPELVWAEAGLLAVSAFGSPIAYQVDNLSSGESWPLFAPPNETIGQAFLSRDGAKAAIWDSQCLESADYSCTKWRDVLYVVDTVSGRPERVARAEGGSGRVAFSADNRRVAYVYQGRLYVSELR